MAELYHSSYDIEIRKNRHVRIVTDTRIYKMYRYLINNINKNVQKISQTRVLNYHTENVYGHRNKEKSEYEISKQILENRQKECNFYRLVQAYRSVLHIIFKKFSKIIFNNPILT